LLSKAQTLLEKRKKVVAGRTALSLFTALEVRASVYNGRLNVEGEVQPTSTLSVSVSV
jgi:hypothetical protein